MRRVVAIGRGEGGLSPSTYQEPARLIEGLDNQTHSMCDLSWLPNFVHDLIPKSVLVWLNHTSMYTSLSLIGVLWANASTSQSVNYLYWICTLSRSLVIHTMSISCLAASNDWLCTTGSLYVETFVDCTWDKTCAWMIAAIIDCSRTTSSFGNVAFWILLQFLTSLLRTFLNLSCPLLLGQKLCMTQLQHGFVPYAKIDFEFEI